MTITILSDGLKAHYDGKVFDINVHPSIPIPAITEICSFVKVFNNKVTECQSIIERDSKRRQKITHVTSILRGDILVLLSLLTQPYCVTALEASINRAIRHIDLLRGIGVDFSTSSLGFRKYIKFVH